MLRTIDAFLNTLTMYKVVLFGMLTITATALVLAATGNLPYSFFSLVVSLCILSITCYGSNKLISLWLRAPINAESATITALILFFIFPPANTFQDAIVLCTAGFAAMASKYVLALYKKHLFNPVAIAAVVVAAIGVGGATWWVATPTLLPATAIVGLLIVRKVRRFSMFTAYTLTAVLSIAVMNIRQDTDVLSLLSEVVVSWPVLFLGTIMLTEPLTTPPTRRLQVLYGAVVGALLGLKYQFGPFYGSPESALVLGNIFSYLVSPKQKLFLQLDTKRKLADTVYEFVFRTTQKPVFTAGQYMEWLLPHENPDLRGNRRYFTIASSPTEPELKLGIKLPDKPSSFKEHLVELEKGGTIVAAQLAGDFVLPKDTTQKLVFIAGGIGVTPFRSMAQYLVDTGEKRDIQLLYCCSSADEFVYQDVFAAAESVGLKTTYVITHAEDAPKNWKGLSGRLTTQVLAKQIPDYAERTFYLSGPNAMVHAYEDNLEELRVPTAQIKKDYFPGF